MKLVIEKGILSIVGTKPEAGQIEATALSLEETEEFTVCSGGDEYGEYWVDLTYDARDHTVAEIRKMYKEVRV